MDGLAALYCGLLDCLGLVKLSLGHLTQRVGMSDGVATSWSHIVADCDHAGCAAKPISRVKSRQHQAL